MIRKKSLNIHTKKYNLHKRMLANMCHKSAVPDESSGKLPKFEIAIQDLFPPLSTAG